MLYRMFTGFPSIGTNRPISSLTPTLVRLSIHCRGSHNRSMTERESYLKPFDRPRNESSAEEYGSRLDLRFELSSTQMMIGHKDSRRRTADAG
jgi:hypothetical protein